MKFGAFDLKNKRKIAESDIISSIFPLVTRGRPETQQKLYEKSLLFACLSRKLQRKSKPK